MPLYTPSGVTDRITLGGGLLQVSAAGGLTWTPTAGQTFTVASGGLTVTAGGLTVSAGGVTVTGNSTITGTLGSLTGLTVATGGATITAGGLTVTAGGLTVTAGNLAVGAAVDSTIGLYVTGNITTGVGQYGMAVNPYFSSAATTSAKSIHFQFRTAAASFTIPYGYVLYCATPVLGSQSNVTTLSGCYVENQGATGVTNAYGIYVAAQSGAATTNIGIYVAGSGITVAGGGASITGNSTITGTLGGVTTLTATQLASPIGVGANGTGSGLTVGAASSNNSIWSASQGAATATLYIGNASINVTSDMRLKMNIVPTTYDALALIGRLRPVDYTWADPSDTAEVNRNSRGRWTGLLAQEVVDVVPWVVNAPDRTCPTCRAGLACERHEAYWRIEYDQLAGLFVRAFQQTTEEIATLKARLEAAGIN